MKKVIQSIAYDAKVINKTFFEKKNFKFLNFLNKRLFSQKNLKFIILLHRYQVIRNKSILGLKKIN